MRLILFFLIPTVLSCEWPDVDALFIIDGTPTVSTSDHQHQLRFIQTVSSSMRISSDHCLLAVAQFTPMEKLEFGLNEGISRENVKNRLTTIPYTPCVIDKEKGVLCEPTASLNSISRRGLSAGNRKWIPDVVVVISRGELPMKLSSEVLISPQSPTHVFHITIGAAPADTGHFEASATSISFSSSDFSLLPRLSEPLCQATRQFVAGSPSNPTFGTLCWPIIAAVVLVCLLLLLLLGYSWWLQRDEANRLRRKVVESEKTLRTQNEYFTAKLHQQMEEHQKNTDKLSDELRRQQEALASQKEHFYKERSANQQLQPPPIIIPVYQPPAAAPADHGRLVVDTTGNRRHADSASSRGVSRRHRRRRKSSETSDGRESLAVPEELRKARSSELLQRIAYLEGSMNAKHSDPFNQSHSRFNGILTGRREKKTKDEKTTVMKHPHWARLDLSETSSEATDDVGEAGAVRVSHASSHLPLSHPARQLTPVDLLVLIDSSSSIGIHNFEKLKKFVCSWVADMDLGALRSRVAVVQYAAEPRVVFDFDRYYTVASVQAAVNRLSYTGGPTHLAKALSFCAGLLWQEQNMKEKKRKHKLAPTPRHDRLQVLFVLSDGSTEEGIEHATRLLHENMQIRVGAVVTKSFNRARMAAVTRFEGAVFVIDQLESINMWMWRQQRLWTENYSSYVERERSMPLTNRSPEKSKKDKGDTHPRWNRNPNLKKSNITQVQ